MDEAVDFARVRAAKVGDVPQLCELLFWLFPRNADFVPLAERRSRGFQLIFSQPETELMIRWNLIKALAEQT